MSTGVNMEVIATSERYKMNTYFNVSLVLLTIIFNVWLINVFGLTGAALASVLSVLIINSMRWYYLKRKFGFQPFDGAFGKAFLFGAIALIGVSFLSFDVSPLISAGIQFIIISLVYWFVVIRFSFSDDINAWIKKMKKKFFPS